MRNAFFIAITLGFLALGPSNQSLAVHPNLCAVLTRFAQTHPGVQPDVDVIVAAEKELSGARFKEARNILNAAWADDEAILATRYYPKLSIFFTHWMMADAQRLQLFLKRAFARSSLVFPVGSFALSGIALGAPYVLVIKSIVAGSMLGLEALGWEMGSLPSFEWYNLVVESFMYGPLLLVGSQQMEGIREILLRGNFAGMEGHGFTDHLETAALRGERPEPSLITSSLSLPDGTTRQIETLVVFPQVQGQTRALVVVADKKLLANSRNRAEGSGQQNDGDDKPQRLIFPSLVFDDAALRAFFRTADSSADASKAKLSADAQKARFSWHRNAKAVVRAVNEIPRREREDNSPSQQLVVDGTSIVISWKWNAEGDRIHIQNVRGE